MQNKIQVRDSRFHDDGSRVRVQLDLQNDEKRTLYAIASPRHLNYDAATRTLHVALFEPEPKAGGTTAHRSMFALPHFKALEPERVTTVEVSLPREIKKMLPGQGDGVLRVDVWPIHEVETFRLEMAVQNVPFYADTRKKGAAKGRTKQRGPSIDELQRALSAWGKDRLTIVVKGPGNRKGKA
jgi:hypothetical protein